MKTSHNFKTVFDLKPFKVERVFLFEYCFFSVFLYFDRFPVGILNLQDNDFVDWKILHDRNALRILNFLLVFEI